MLNRIIQFSISNKPVVGLLTVGLVFWGSYSLTQLPLDAVPDITNNQVQVITVAPSQSAPDIERLVTFPIEQSISSIPGIEEIRSFSRFGLSVVTIVFEDAIDVYWARQQVGERLAVARNLIPAGVGTPTLAPVTTGLGEIYQYIIRPKPAYEGRYTTMELRTIQDWIVRRQLLGTRGVADVSSFGGHLKQYEIALDPQELRSLRLSIADVFLALEKNNQNTGGAYIEKNPVAYFIRSEGLLQTLEDIGNIVVESRNGVPVLIKHIGTMKLGHAIRFGAMTRDGTQETVGAVVMMLKGENSSEVIERVKARIVQIEKTLPEGLVIEPFLDRTKLVNSAIETVALNLAEGALIVVLVLILLLGNWRAGLLVASVIPLAMLFAFCMMNVFHVSGNLMSLGAIDFGLIVDGAVIIVEATLLHIVTKTNHADLTALEMDQEVSGATQKMMSAAAFGQVIILIVYLPILSLAGIEGKMFKPMAQTVVFAILGALILSLTYIPAASALLLSRKIQHRRTSSDRIMEWLRGKYEPVMSWSLHHKAIIISSTFGLFLAGLFLFATLGGEFLPELDEGDFAVETRLLTGSSLTSTVEATLKGQQVLLKHFPEVEKVIGKIGSSEIPTDPMPMEAADMMVIMKDKSQWTTTQTKNEMIEKMQKKLEENIPGVFFGFQHPIQMRFNELMTGARQDVVIKIYGEDLDRLSYFAKQIGAIVSYVAGAEDLFVERATGLPQIVIRFNRERLGAFGINILDINNVINASLAGQSAGIVYEGEKRFDLVVRLTEEKRQSIEDIRNLFIPVPKGGMITLNQVADVEFQVGPNQIQRDDAKRRIIVGFNVRGRDVESIVNEVQQKINTQIQFDPGYYASYGGSFKNLEEARGRLIIAVPIALALIFILLFFTFHSIKLGTLIFTAIPLSAIGGILALWIRGMPFSISAGVGFIALFGVAVLNGIVLIAEFNRLKKDGLTDPKQIVMKGTQTRLRPVLMTATVASLGFLPMALSQGSGAEVQKPLATVVIGGLVSATFLTLIVLPCLYVAFGDKAWRPGKEAVIGSILLFLFMSTSTFSQKKISLPEAIEMAIQKHPEMKAAMFEIDQREKMKKGSGEFPKTSIMFMKGQYNTAKRDNNITLTQTIPLTALGPRQHLASAQLKSASFKKDITKSTLIYQVSVTFNQLLFTAAKAKLLVAQDSLFADLVRANSLRYQAGEGTLLEKISAETQAQESKNLINLNEADLAHLRRELQLLVQSKEPVDADGSFSPLEVLESMDTVSLSQNPHLKLALQAGEIAKQERKVEVNRILPDLHVGYFNQTLIGYQNTTGSDQYFGPGHRFSGFLLGVSLPLWFFPNSSSLQAARINEDVVEAHTESQRLALQSQYSKAQQEIIGSQNAIKYYLNNALPNANLMMRQGTLSFKNGEIDYVTYLVHLRTALGIQENYLALVKRFNEQIIHYQYLQGL